MKKWLAFSLMLVVCCMLTGCWNYREIDSLSIVAGVAIERDPESGGYILFIEIIEPGGKEQAAKSKIVASRGKSMFDAARNTIDASGKRLFWNHAQLVIVSEEIAKQGILDVLDWFYRDAEPRLTLRMVVANGASAKDIITSDGLTNEIRSLEINNKLKNANSVETYPQIELYQLLGMLKFSAPYAYMPSVIIKSRRI
jgi:spore germination protein KC